MFEFDKVLPPLPKNALLIGVLISLKEASIKDLAILHDLIVDIYGDIDPKYPIENAYDHDMFKYNQGKFFLIDEKSGKNYLEKITSQFKDQKLKAAFVKAIKKFSKQT